MGWTRNSVRVRVRKPASSAVTSSSSLPGTRRPLKPRLSDNARRRPTASAHQDFLALPDVLRLLTPVSFIEHPATSALDPTGRHPNYAGPWRTNPPAGDPYIAGAVPTLVAANPDIPGSRCGSNYPDSNRWRRRNTNHRLCRSNHSSQQQHSPKNRPRVAHFHLVEPPWPSLWPETEVTLTDAAGETGKTHS